MAKNLATPILYLKNDKKYILMTIAFSEDGSIYFSFPSNQKRVLSSSSIKEYENVEYIERTRNLEKIDNGILEPKISFHPKDMIVHVNTNQSREKSEDLKLYNVSGDDEILVSYLLQVLFTRNEQFYTEYNKTKHSDYLVIEDSKLEDNEIICLEFFVHSKDVIIPNESLPFSKNRNLKVGYNFGGSNSDYTYTMFISTLNDDNSNNNFILFNINTRYKNCIYTIANKEN